MRYTAAAWREPESHSRHTVAGCKEHRSVRDSDDKSGMEYRGFLNTGRGRWRIRTKVSAWTALHEREGVGDERADESVVYLSPSVRRTGWKA